MINRYMDIFLERFKLTNGLNNSFNSLLTSSLDKINKHCSINCSFINLIIYKIIIYLACYNL